MGNEVSLSKADLADLSDILARLVMAAAEAEGQEGEAAAEARDTEGLSAWLLARELLHHRRQRSRFFPGQLFGEPGWDMLLTLFAIAPTASSVPLDVLKSSATVPSSTADRWVQYLLDQDLVTRSLIEDEGGTTFISLTPSGRRSMSEYLRSLIGQPNWQSQLKRQLGNSK